MIYNLVFFGFSQHAHTYNSINSSISASKSSFLTTPHLHEIIVPVPLTATLGTSNKALLFFFLLPFPIPYVRTQGGDHFSGYVF